jgi:hypothetical protein
LEEDLVVVVEESVPSPRRAVSVAKEVVKHPDHLHVISSST